MSSTMTRDSGGLGTIQSLTPGEVDQLEWRSVPGCPGVGVKELWRSGDLHDALISYRPSCRTPGKPHTGANHHIWVVSGSASIAGCPVTAGSYVYVPPGTVHPIEAGTEGCLLLQMHRPRTEMRDASSP